MTQVQSWIYDNQNIDFESYKKHGYYQVGNRIFNHKIRALQEATSSGQQIRWFFNPEVFDKLNWQISSNVSLDQLYCLRAKQLREKYNYLILFFSGGADSTNILQSFIRNGIKLDEVVVGWPLSQTKNKYKVNSVDTTTKNYLSEWDLSIKPKLDWLSANHPQIKITICDVLANPTAEDFSEHLATLLTNCSYVGIKRNIELDKVLRDRTEKYSSCAAIYGYSPVDCAVVDQRYLVAFFSDTVIGGGLTNDYHPMSTYQRNIEFFYWTPDMPEIVREQGHAVLNYINSNPSITKLFPQLDSKLQYVNDGDSNLLHRVRKTVLYPTWQECLQVDKPNDQIGYSSWQSWWHDHEHSAEFEESWASAISSEINIINHKYLGLRNAEKNQNDLLTKSLLHQPSNKFVVNYKSLLSKWYPLGKISNRV